MDRQAAVQITLTTLARTRSTEIAASPTHGEKATLATMTTATTTITITAMTTITITAMTTTTTIPKPKCGTGKVKKAKGD